MPHPLRLAPLVVLAFSLLSPALRAQAPEAPLTAADRAAAVARIAEVLDARYVSQEQGVAAGRHVQEQLAAGAYDALGDADAFAARLTADLQSVAHDRHLRVRLRPPAAAQLEQTDPAAALAARRRAARASNNGFVRVERLEGNVGYLRFDQFGPLPDVRETAVAAMRMLAGADAVVIDLRYNGGGSPETVQFLASYFFDQPTHLNSLYWREGDRTMEFWTLPEVPGERLADVPVFVLTSRRTFSGAEEFSYDLQAQGRATLVGDTTGGGANPGGDVPVSERLRLFVPTGRAVNPVTGTNWEGVGVVPHVAVASEEALEAALPLARTAAEEHRAAALAAEEAGRADLHRATVRAEELIAEGRADEAEGVMGAALEVALLAGLLTEDGLNLMGYGYLEQGKTAMAIAVFRANVAAFPASSNTYDSLGEAYMAAGQTALAIENYERSVELNPDNENGRQMLARLRGE